MEGSSASHKGKGKEKVITPDINIDDIEFTDDDPFSTFDTQESVEITKVRSKPPLKSSIFTKHFKKVTLPSGETRAQCKYCTVSYKFQSGGGYGSLKRHVETKHPVEFGNVPSQTQLSRFISDKGNNSQLFKYSDAQLRESMARFVSVEHLSFSIASRFSFEDLCHESLQPAAKRIPRTTLTRTLKKLVREKKKELIKEFFTLKNKVSICSDIWSDHWQTHSYMGITCHWVDSSWTIQKRLIAYRVFDEAHTAENISRLICLILEEYGLTSKIFSVSFDNASSNTLSIEELKRVCQPAIGGLFFHIRCTCHVFNLCVQDGLKSLDIYIKPIKLALSYLWGHPNVMKQWGRFCKANNVRPRKFPRDIPTRWNSTYKLLNDSFEYRELLCSFFTQYSGNSNIYLFPHQWNVCKAICEILEVFNNATEQLSGVYYPTSHLVLINCCNIALILNEYIDNEFLGTSVQAMKTKWEKYFYTIPEIFLVAFVLDPRYKLDLLSEMLTVYYDALYPIKNLSSLDPSILVNQVRNYLYEIYNDYNLKYGIQETESESHQTQFKTSTLGSTKLTKAQLILKDRIKRPKGSSSSRQELENYFTTSFDFSEADDEQEFDILRWWSQKTTSFPILSIIAKEILACPVSTVAVEQAFSAGGNILDVRRSKLNPDSLEAQALLDDWTRAAKRVQEIGSSSELDDFDTEGTTTTATGDGSD